MSRKKIALVNVFFPPQSIGGATRVLADNLQTLRETYADCFDLVGFTTNFGAQPDHTLDVYGHAGMRVYRAGAPRRANMDWNPRDEQMGALFRSFLEFERPDVVHFHCVQRLTGSVVETTRDAGIPYLVTIHDAWWISDHQFLVDQNGVVYPHGHPDAEVPYGLPTGVTLEASVERRDYLKSLLRDAQSVLPVSEAFAEIYRRNGVSNVTVNRNGVPPRQWLPRVASESGRVRLAHIGGMSVHKGYDLFREALAGSGFENLEALVVDLSKPHGYRRQTNWNGFPVTVIGKVPQEQTAELYARLDVLVAPSRWPESFGLVTREAAAAGAWVIASDIGAIGEDVEPGINGELVAAGDIASLREAFRRINAEPDRYRLQLPATVASGVEAQADKLAKLYERSGGKDKTPAGDPAALQWGRVAANRR